MSLCLTKYDWMMITRVIYQVGCTRDLDELSRTLPTLLNELVPFGWGSMTLAEQPPIAFTASRRNQPSEAQELVSRELARSPHVRCLLLGCNTRAQRGPSRSELENAPGCSAVPEDPDHALVMPLHHQNEPFGYIALFGDIEAPAFSDRNHCSLKELQPHVSLQVMKLRHTLNARQAGNSLHAMESALEAYELTRREIEVVCHLASELSDDEVCQELFISKSTFKKHLNHIYAKLGVHNRAGLFNAVNRLVGTQR